MLLHLHDKVLITSSFAALMYINTTAMNFNKRNFSELIDREYKDIWLLKVLRLFEGPSENR